MRTDTDRRRFLATGGAALSATWLASQWPLALQAAETASARHQQGAPLRHLDALEAADFEAIAARILPTTQTPGARDAGVIYFIDASIGGWMRGVEQMLRPSLAALNEQVKTTYPADRFHQLDGSAQDALLRGIEDGPFFGTMRMMTLAGMFALPEYGGNRNQLGWSLIGFDPQHVWRPPFGHYDAPFHEAKDGAPGAAAGGHDHGH